MVQEWQARLASLTTKSWEIQNEMAFLARRLDAAKVIMGDLPVFKPTEEVHEADEAETPANPSADTLTDAVLLAVDALGGLPAPADIRTWIARERPALAAQLKSSPNYFYTVLLRHVQKKRLIRDGAGYRRP